MCGPYPSFTHPSFLSLRCPHSLSPFGLLLPFGPWSSFHSSLRSLAPLPPVSPFPSSFPAVHSSCLPFPLVFPLHSSLYSPPINTSRAGPSFGLYASSLLSLSFPRLSRLPPIRSVPFSLVVFLSCLFLSFLLPVAQPLNLSAPPFGIACLIAFTGRGQQVGKASEAKAKR